MQFFRQDRRDNLQVLIRLFSANRLNDGGAVLLEVLVQFGDKFLAQLVPRTFRPTGGVARLARLELPGLQLFVRCIISHLDRPNKTK